jgi:hypothetical protein
MSVEQQDFPTILKGYYPKIIRCLSKVVGVADAEDITQMHL